MCKICTFLYNCKGEKHVCMCVCFSKINILNPLMSAWIAQAGEQRGRSDVENVPPPAWSRMNRGERQVSLWCFDYWLWKFPPSFLSRLCSSQSFIISRSVSLPIGTRCLSLPSFLAIALPFLWLLAGGRWRKCKCSSVLLPSDRSGCYNCWNFLISTHKGHKKLYIKLNK